MVETIWVDPPGPGEVRLQLLASGLCHTDVMVIRGDWWRDYPYVLGHEGVGVVESIGTGVPDDLLGRTAVLAWRASCGRCRFCLRSLRHLCVDLPWAPGRVQTSDGTRVTPSLRLGTHATHVTVAASQVIAVPDGLDHRSVCTIGCAVLTGVGAVFNTAVTMVGATVAVFGCGGVGLSVVQGARLAHASVIIAIDRVPARLDAARRMGAHHTLLADDTTVETVRAITGSGVDFAFEAVGVASVAATAVRVCDVGGTVVLLGTPGKGQSLDLPMSELFFPRLKVVVSQYGDAVPSRDVPLLASLYAGGSLLLDDLVSSTIGLSEAPAALATLESARTLRTVIDFVTYGG